MVNKERATCDFSRYDNVSMKKLYETIHLEKSNEDGH